MSSFADYAEKIRAVLCPALPREWDGKAAILEMKESGFRHWKQMEWIGFYFQFLCERVLAGVMEMPGPRFGKVEFDGFLGVPWDFKAHAINTSHHQIIVNDSEAIAAAVSEYGALGVILASGNVDYNDEERTFQRWHEEIKGGPSPYTLERIRRGAWSRLRKVRFSLQQIAFIKITDETLVKCGSFQQDFRNADGSPRKPKVLINLEKLDEEIVLAVDY